MAVRFQTATDMPQPQTNENQIFPESAWQLDYTGSIKLDSPSRHYSRAISAVLYRTATRQNSNDRSFLRITSKQVRANGDSFKHMAHAYRLGFWRRSINRIVGGLLRLGVSPAHTYLLTVSGRKTGRPYSTPVRLVEEHGRRWLVAPYGAVGWVRNARAAGEVILRRGRRSETVKIIEAQPEEAAPVLKSYVEQVPITRPFFDVTPKSRIEDFRAEAPRHPVFRVLR